MARWLRATLPNGAEVAVNPFMEGGEGSGAALAEQAEHLAQLLKSDNPTEAPLLDFLMGAAATIFHEAGPGVRPLILAGQNALGVDLLFDLPQTGAVGAVQIKTGRYRDAVIDDRMLSSFGTPIDGREVRFLYIVAGRDPDFGKGRSRRGEVRGVPVYTLSWDDVIHRLSIVPPVKDDPGYKVILVELVKVSRNLLSALASEGLLWHGIDDRKFEVNRTGFVGGLIP